MKQVTQDFYFDKKAAASAVRFFERYLVHIKGKWAGESFRLEKWQQDDIIVPLFGCRRADGSRQYRTCYIEIPRKNGKSSLCSGIALYLLFADNEASAEVYSAAADTKQAAIVFNVAKGMLADSTPIMQLASIIPMSGWKRQLPRQLTSVSVGWVAEGARKPVSNPTFGQLEQVAKVMAAVIKCTDELLRDSAINLTAFLSELISEAMALEIERVALTGNTAEGDPFNGILNASGVKVVPMAGNDVDFNDIIELLFSLSAANSQGATLVLNRNGLKRLIKLRDNQGNYIWQPPTGNIPATIWNSPYAICPTIPDNLGEDSNMGDTKTIAEAVTSALKFAGP